jgi:hypothetical protein
MRLIPIFALALVALMSGTTATVLPTQDFKNVKTTSTSEMHAAPSNTAFAVVNEGEIPITQQLDDVTIEAGKTKESTISVSSYNHVIFN